LPHYVQVAGRSLIEVTLTFCTPLPPRTGELPEDFAARARNAILRCLDRWRNWLRRSDR
jgi:hypothetical protein